MRIVIVFLLVFSATANSQTTNPFAKLKFDSVVMYDFDGGKDSDLAVIDNNGN